MTSVRDPFLIRYYFRRIRTYQTRLVIGCGHTEVTTWKTQEATVVMIASLSRHTVVTKARAEGESQLYQIGMPQRSQCFFFFCTDRCNAG